MKHFDSILDIPDIPVVKTEALHKDLCNELIRCGALPKQELEVGATYEGSCRNSSIATWNGQEFEYNRTKWGTTYIDTIKHFEDDMYYDVFIPLHKIETPIA